MDNFIKYGGRWAAVLFSLAVYGVIGCALFGVDQKPLVINQTTGKQEQLQSGNSLLIPGGGLTFGSSTSSTGQVAFPTSAASVYFGNFGNPSGNEAGFSVPGIQLYKVNTSTYAHTFSNGVVSVSNSTASTSTTTGALVVTGGGGFGGAIYTGGLITSGSTTLIATSVALTNGAGASAGTLTNAPSVGNPTKWVPINDNGTTRYIPAW